MMNNKAELILRDHYPTRRVLEVLRLGNLEESAIEIFDRVSSLEKYFDFYEDYCRENLFKTYPLPNGFKYQPTAGDLILVTQGNNCKFFGLILCFDRVIEKENEVLITERDFYLLDVERAKELADLSYITKLSQYFKSSSNHNTTQYFICNIKDTEVPNWHKE